MRETLLPLYSIRNKYRERVPSNARLGNSHVLVAPPLRVIAWQNAHFELRQRCVGSEDWSLRFVPNAATRDHSAATNRCLARCLSLSSASPQVSETTSICLTPQIHITTSLGDYFNLFDIANTRGQCFARFCKHAKFSGAKYHV